LLAFNFFFDRWIELRLRPVFVGRVGELWTNPWYQTWLCSHERKRKRKNLVLLFFCFFYPQSRTIANSTILEFWRRNFYFLPGWLSFSLSNIPSGSFVRRVFWKNYLFSWTHDSGEHTLEFLEAAPQTGKTGEIDLLVGSYFRRNQQRLGRKERFDRPWVMIQVRDSRYLSQVYPAMDWSHHSFRDQDIRLFSDSVTYLLDRGYAVVRSGRQAKSPLKVKGDYVLDMPFAVDVSEDEECYLWSNCAFAIGTGSGPDVAAAVSSRPLFYFDALPVPKSESLVFPAWLWFAKRLKNRSTGVDLLLKEMREQLAYKWYKTDDYEQNGVEIVRASQDDLLSLTVEVESLFQRFGTNKELYIPRLRLYPWLEPDSSNTTSDVSIPPAPHDGRRSQNN
jgi:putative glycosyltransferase (TIGR04372 family)